MPLDHISLVQLISYTVAVITRSPDDANWPVQYLDQLNKLLNNNCGYKCIMFSLENSPKMPLHRTYR